MEEMQYDEMTLEDIFKALKKRGCKIYTRYKRDRSEVEVWKRCSLMK